MINHIDVAAAKLLNREGKVVDGRDYSLANLPSFSDFRREVRTGKDVLQYGDYFVRIRFGDAPSRHGSSIMISRSRHIANVMIDIEQCQSFAVLLNIPLKTVVGIALHHELGHLEAHMRGEQDLGKIGNERRAWRYAIDFVSQRLPPSWSGIALNNYRALENFCMSTYELDPHLPPEKALDQVLKAAGLGATVRRRVLEAEARLREIREESATSKDDGALV